jgi:branched-chain amino acid aminotransferase
MALNGVVNLNGKLIRMTGAPYLSDEAKVSIFDRGFLYGDSLYEVVRTYDGTPFELSAHLERLGESAHLAHIQLAQSSETLHSEIMKSIAAFREGRQGAQAEAYVRLIVSRGTGKISFSLKAVQTPTQFLVIVLPLSDFLSGDWESGLHLQVSARLRNDARAIDPAMKSGNYLNSLLAYLEAAEKGFHDALLCNADGHLTEGTTFNVFYVRNGVIATPPLDVGILDGISRRHLIDLARAEGIEVREVRFPKERLYEADECFLTSSIKEVFPITQIDRRPIGSGKAGSLTRKLASLFHERVKTVCRKSPA